MVCAGMPLATNCDFNAEICAFIRSRYNCSVYAFIHNEFTIINDCRNDFNILFVSCMM